MPENTNHRLVNLLFGVIIGAIVSLIVGLLLTPRSGSENRDLLRGQGVAFKYKMVNDREIFAERIRSATDEWIAKLRDTANDMVAKGYISSEEATSQINKLLAKVRG